ncbi:helix-turn-helix domain-containing protein [Candidatus Bathyarchaeota archaeon]|nr:helix-turn-helix domain-containing protein [Candidatus Bathyarchaeota archaeon]
MSEEVKAALKEMGLTEYEMRAYLYLLKAGLSTASQLSDEANIPYSKVYEVLNSLERRGWIKVRRIGLGFITRGLLKKPLKRIGCVWRIK